jgi:hypothetical protein
LFLIHRNSLIINPETLKAEIEAHFAESNFRSRMQNSTSICVNAARSIVNVLSHLLERHPDSILLSLYAPLISVYALAIHIIKNPGNATARTDLEVKSSQTRCNLLTETYANRYLQALAASSNLSKRRKQTGLSG